MRQIAVIIIAPILLSFIAQWFVGHVLMRFPEWVRRKRILEFVLLPAHSYWLIWRWTGILLVGLRPRIFFVKFPGALVPDILCRSSLKGCWFKTLRRGFIYIFPLVMWLITIAFLISRCLGGGNALSSFGMIVLVGYVSLEMRLPLGIWKDVVVPVILIGTVAGAMAYFGCDISCETSIVEEALLYWSISLMFAITFLHVVSRIIRSDSHRNGIGKLAK